MKNCECCGNTYDKSFELTIGGTTHTFDSLQCAIHVLAPRLVALGPPEAASADDLWESIRRQFVVTPDYINLENGYYLLLPTPVLEAFIAEATISA